MGSYEIAQSCLTACNICCRSLQGIGYGAVKASPSYSSGVLFDEEACTVASSFEPPTSKRQVHCCRNVQVLQEKDKDTGRVLGIGWQLQQLESR